MRSVFLPPNSRGWQFLLFQHSASHPPCLSDSPHALGPLMWLAGNRLTGFRPGHSNNPTRAVAPLCLLLQMPAFQQQQQTSSRSMADDSHDQQQLDSSQRGQQHWDSEADEEVCSCATAAHEQGPMMPLHRVKRVWSHLCMMELAEADCFDA